jgi:hypothetical protein
MQVYVGEKYKSNMFLTPQAQRATLQALTQQKRERMRECGGRRGTSKLREVARKVVVAATYACV